MCSKAELHQIKMKTVLPILVVAPFLALFSGVKCQLPEEALIDTGEDQLGKIQGSTAWTMGGLGAVGRKYYWFTGMPYAKPESYTGENRFKPSEVWDGKLPDDTEYGEGIFYADLRKGINCCPQNAILNLGIGTKNKSVDLSSVRPLELLRSYYSKEGMERRRDLESGIWGDEECLIVTVSTPQLQDPENKTKLPVLFFIHGGGFDAFWGSVFGGQRLLNHDMILVTLNYRLGVLGSLSLGIDDAPGNAALYDCITALKWVKKYIHLFGGDPDRVVVSGQSAGAVYATTVFLSPLAKGLFSGAIGDSGSAMSVWANQKNPIEETLKVVGFTSCEVELPKPPGSLTPERAKAIRDCMQKLTKKELVQAREHYGSAEGREARLGYDAFVPSVQKASASLTIPLALNDTPVNIVKNGLQSNVPLMMGATRHDGSFVFVGTFYNYLVGNGLDSDASYIRNEFLPKFMKGVGLEDPTGALLHAFQKAYLGDAANSDDILSKMPGLLDIHSAVGFKAGAYNLVEGHAKLNPNSYYYAFDYKGLFTTYGFSGGINEVPGGIAHVDDLLYLFQLIPLLNEKDWRVSDRYVEYWANFVIHGNPNGPGNLDEPFPRFNGDDHRFLIINDTDKIGYHCRDTWFGNANELWK